MGQLLYFSVVVFFSELSIYFELCLAEELAHVPSRMREVVRGLGCTEPAQINLVLLEVTTLVCNL